MLGLPVVTIEFSELSSTSEYNLGTQKGRLGFSPHSSFQSLQQVLYEQPRFSARPPLLKSPAGFPVTLSKVAPFQNASIIIRIRQRVRVLDEVLRVPRTRNRLIDARHLLEIEELAQVAAGARIREV